MQMEIPLTAVSLRWAIHSPTVERIVRRTLFTDFGDPLIMEADVACEYPLSPESMSP